MVAAAGGLAPAAAAAAAAEAAAAEARAAAAQRGAPGCARRSRGAAHATTISVHFHPLRLLLLLLLRISRGGVTPPGPAALRLLRRRAPPPRLGLRRRRQPQPLRRRLAPRLQPQRLSVGVSRFGEEPEIEGSEAPARPGLGVGWVVLSGGWAGGQEGWAGAGAVSQGLPKNCSGCPLTGRRRRQWRSAKLRSELPRDTPRDSGGGGARPVARVRERARSQFSPPHLDGSGCVLECLAVLLQRGVARAAVRCGKKRRAYGAGAQRSMFSDTD